MSALAERLTADVYLAREDERRTELIDGIVHVNSPALLHQEVCGRVFEALRAWSRTEAGFGLAMLHLDVRLDDHNVLAPDLLFFAEPLGLGEIRAPRVPDLAVEVRSPGTWSRDIGRKRTLYEHHGLRELWLVDSPARTVLVHRRSSAAAGFDVHTEVGEDERLESPLLPAFSVPVGELIPAVG